jgi:hypothetical protein
LTILAGKEFNKMVYSIGKFDSMNSEIRKVFGFDYDKLKIEEKRYLWYIYIRRTELTFFEKRKAISQKNQKSLRKWSWTKTATAR